MAVDTVQSNATDAIHGTTDKKSIQIGVSLPKALYESIVSQASKRGIEDKGEPYTAGFFARIVLAETVGYDWRKDLERSPRAPKANTPAYLVGKTASERAKIKRETEKAVLAANAALSAQIMEMVAKGMTQEQIMKKLAS